MVKRPKNVLLYLWQGGKAKVTTVEKLSECSTMKGFFIGEKNLP
jgi:hypothetical protein